MAAHGVTPQTLVVAYDASGGMYAAHLWWMLRWLGHERVAVLDGGWQAWTAAGLPVSTEPGVAARPGQPVEPGASLAATVDAATVLANIAQPAFTVIDARAASRYRGEVEPMDPVAGHIPGALNRPNGENLRTDGRFKAPEQLRAEFTALLAGRDPAAIVHQCGSGITACHNLLSMEIAGLSGSRLYPGSWASGAATRRVRWPRAPWPEGGAPVPPAGMKARAMPWLLLRPASLAERRRRPGREAGAVF